MKARSVGLGVVGILLLIGVTILVRTQPSLSASSSSVPKERFVATDPMPSAAYTDGDAFLSEIKRRVQQWASELDVASLSEDELVRGIKAIDEWLASTENQWPKTRELADRQSLLCLHLPEKHPLQGYCE